MEDKLANYLTKFELAHGIDPLYFATIWMIIISLIYYRRLKNWENLELWRKGLIISSYFAAVVFSIMSIIQLLSNL